MKRRGGWAPRVASSSLYGSFLRNHHRGPKQLSALRIALDPNGATTAGHWPASDARCALSSPSFAYRPHAYLRRFLYRALPPPLSSPRRQNTSNLPVGYIAPSIGNSLIDNEINFAPRFTTYPSTATPLHSFTQLRSALPWLRVTKAREILFFFFSFFESPPRPCRVKSVLPDPVKRCCVVGFLAKKLYISPVWFELSRYICRYRFLKSSPPPSLLATSPQSRLSFPTLLRFYIGQETTTTTIVGGHRV